MRLLPEFFWTSMRYRKIRTYILALLVALSGCGLLSFLSPPLWAYVLATFIITQAVIVLREK